MANDALTQKIVFNSVLIREMCVDNNGEADSDTRKE